MRICALWRTNRQLKTCLWAAFFLPVFFLGFYVVYVVFVRLHRCYVGKGGLVMHVFCEFIGKACIL